MPLAKRQGALVRIKGTGKLAKKNFACPADCTSCADDITVTVTGTTLDGGNFNDTYSLSKSGSSCTWTGTGDTNGYDATYYCEDGVWKISIDNGSGDTLAGAHGNTGGGTFGNDECPNDNDDEYDITEPEDEPGTIEVSQPTPSACPDCSSGCESSYFSTITMTSGTCNGSNCTDISGQELTQVGSTCQWTAADSPWNHELVCEDGTWYYRVWNGAIGSGTLCVEWTHQEAVTDCPPLGTEAGGTWSKTDGDCVPSEFSTAKGCPVDCSGQGDMVVSIHCPGGDDTQTWEQGGGGACTWEPTTASGQISCNGGRWALSYFKTSGNCAFRSITIYKPNTDDTPEGHYSGGTGETADVTAS